MKDLNYWMATLFIIGIVVLSTNGCITVEVVNESEMEKEEKGLINK